MPLLGQAMVMHAKARARTSAPDGPTAAKARTNPGAGSAGLHTTASQVVEVRPARVARALARASTRRAHGSGGLTCRACSWASTTRTRMADRFVSRGTSLEDAQKARMEPATAAFTCVPSASERTRTTNARRKGPTDYRCQCKVSLLPLPRRPDDYTHFSGLRSSLALPASRQPSRILASEEASALIQFCTKLD